MTSKCKRECAVRPQVESNQGYIKTMHSEAEQVGIEEVHPEEKEQSTWEELKSKIEDLETNVIEQLEDDQGDGKDKGRAPWHQSPKGFGKSSGMKRRWMGSSNFDDDDEEDL